MGYSIKAPGGEDVTIPVDVNEATDTYLKLTSDRELREFYDENGYVVFRNLIPAELCDASLKAFDREVKTFDGYIYRQATAKPEKHKFTEHGHILNSILNIQDLNSNLFPGFKQEGLKILAHDNMLAATDTLFGEPGKLVQSMFFEGNPATWPHQDTYYLDSDSIGSMTAAWVALEDIQPGAGRFYVYPGSHKIDIAKNGGDFDIAFNHDRYKEFVLNLIEDKGLPLVAPALRKGDVLFWNSKTIHGSLETTQPQFSRSSFTAHFIPKSHDLLHFQSMIRTLKLTKINDMLVHQPKNQDRLSNRLVMSCETKFPKTFGLAKKVAIKVLTK
jgi:phytanoyl-CoA hydroxylase